MTAVASSAFAAVAVLALVGVLILAFGQSGTPTAQDRRAQERAAEPRLTAVPEPAVDTRPDAEAAEATPTAVALEPTPTPTPTVPSESTGPSDGAAPAHDAIEVVVLNETKRTGIAAEFRDLLEAGGWTVKRVGDFRGNVPLSTVYYPPGFKTEAEALAAQFPQVDRVRPAFPGAPKKRLTVILCKDYPST